MTRQQLIEKIEELHDRLHEAKKGDVVAMKKSMRNLASGLMSRYISDRMHELQREYGPVSKAAKKQVIDHFVNYIRDSLYNTHVG